MQEGITNDLMLDELYLAGAHILKEDNGATKNKISGVISNWSLERMHSYWYAKILKGKGLPLSHAIELHEKKYPL